MLTSTLFGYVHHSNSGEALVGTFSAGLEGFLFCLLLRDRRPLDAHRLSRRMGLGRRLLLRCA